MSLAHAAPPCRDVYFDWPAVDDCRVWFARVQLETVKIAHRNGSSRLRYEFIAPLTDDNLISVEAWRRERHKCEAVRIRNDHPVAWGMLRHVMDGWRFDYEDDAVSDEPFFNLERQSLARGSSIALTDSDNILRLFRVRSVFPLVELYR